MVAAALLALSMLQTPPTIERIAFGSCIVQDKDQTAIWNAVLKTRPHVFVFLGDNIYHAEGKPFADEYAKLGAQPGYRRLRKEVPTVLATWDDGDYGQNDGGANNPLRDEARRAFFDFWGVAADSPRARTGGVYDAITVGPVGRRVQFILLDTRSFRSPLNRQNNVDGSYNQYLPTKDGTMLGEAQWAWLGARLREPAEVRILCSSIQLVAEDHWFEKWANLPAERRRLFDLVRSTGATGLVTISGDRHLAEISVQTEDVPYPMLDVTASAMTESRTAWRAYETNRRRVGTYNVGNNFGLIRVDWSKADPSLSLEIRDGEGDVVLRHNVALSVLRASG